MCAKKEPHEVYEPLVDLIAELVDYDHFEPRTLPWVGVAAYNALLENL